MIGCDIGRLSGCGTARAVDRNSRPENRDHFGARGQLRGTLIRHSLLFQGAPLAHQVPMILTAALCCLMPRPCLILHRTVSLRCAVLTAIRLPPIAMAAHHEPLAAPPATRRTIPALHLAHPAARDVKKLAAVGEA